MKENERKWNEIIYWKGFLETAILKHYEISLLSTESRGMIK